MMATKRRIGGYVFNQELQRAINANRAARRALSHILDDQASPRKIALYLAQSARDLAENLDALMVLRDIVQEERQ